jgi:hypothetical protein
MWSRAAQPTLVASLDRQGPTMIRVKTQFIVERPAPEVFDFWTDVRNELRYNPSALRVEKTTAGPIGRGTAWSGEYRGMGPLTLSVIEYKRPHRVARQGRARAFDFASFLDFEPTATGTRVIARGELEFRGPFRLLAPVLKPLLDREFVRTMATFRNAAERAVDAQAVPRALVRQFIDAWNARDLQHSYALLDPAIVDHEAPPGAAPGLEGVTQRHAALMAALPDARIVIEDLIAEGDRVAGRFSLQGHAHRPIPESGADRPRGAGGHHRYQPHRRRQNRREVGADGHTRAAPATRHDGAGRTAHCGRVAAIDGGEGGSLISRQQQREAANEDRHGQCRGDGHRPTSRPPTVANVWPPSHFCHRPTMPMANRSQSEFWTCVRATGRPAERCLKNDRLWTGPVLPPATCCRLLNGMSGGFDSSRG